MNIQPGKFYKTRSGLRVRIYANDGGGNLPIHGAFEDGKDFWRLQNWHCNGGRVWDDGYEDELDIVSEWPNFEFDWSGPPKWADRWVAKDGPGEWYCYAEKPSVEPNAQVWRFAKGWPIPKEFAPKFTGDWTDSLHENPKYKNEKLTDYGNVH